MVIAGESDCVKTTWNKLNMKTLKSFYEIIGIYLSMNNLLNILSFG